MYTILRHNWHSYQHYVGLLDGIGDLSGWYAQLAYPSVIFETRASG